VREPVELRRRPQPQLRRLLGRRRLEQRPDDPGLPRHGAVLRAGVRGLPPRVADPGDHHGHLAPHVHRRGHVAAPARLLPDAPERVPEPLPRGSAARSHHDAAPARFRRAPTTSRPTRRG
jgi:hypothetical protein